MFIKPNRNEPRFELSVRTEPRINTRFSVRFRNDPSLILNKNKILIIYIEAVFASERGVTKLAAVRFLAGVFAHVHLYKKDNT